MAVRSTAAMKLKSCLPSRDRLLGNRLVRPFAHRLRDPRLWHLNRESIARGLALGLFIGLLVPIGQTPLAALLAISARAHLIIAAGATLITNPLTVPLIYYAALRLGETILAAADFTAPATESLLSRGLSFAAPIAVGLSFFALVCAAAAYVGVKLFWRIRTIWRWRKRAAAISGWSRSSGGGKPPWTGAHSGLEASPNAMVERHE